MKFAKRLLTFTLFIQFFNSKKKKNNNKLLAAKIYIIFPYLFWQISPVAATKYYMKSGIYLINGIIFTSLCQFV